MIDLSQKQTPINYEIVKKYIQQSEHEIIGMSSIREIVKLVNQIEAESGEKFIRMEMGVPGLPPSDFGVDAEIEALKRGVASKYPPIEGVADLKTEISRFLNFFLDIDVSAESCIPTVGSMQGSLAAFLVAGRRDFTKNTTLILDPGFPVQKQQLRLMHMDYESFDVANFRGEKLREKLESYLFQNNISTILYSSPNNPSWMCFDDEELKIIAEVADKYDVVVIEDLAYFGMDSRQDYSTPGVIPYQPTIAKYTENYILLISSSKAFSYAGQRVGMMVISPTLFNRRFPDLKNYFSSDNFGHAMIYGAIYSLSAGTSHSAQYALAGMLKAANDGEYNFINDVRAYGYRAGEMKRIFLENGFKIVYQDDHNRPIGDGFYFTFCYGKMDGYELLERLLYYGISSIALTLTGSDRKEGLRACVSQVKGKLLPTLEARLKLFNEHHKDLI